jgi:LytS/YehU family sensor histidine kinase
MKMAEKIMQTKNITIHLLFCILLLIVFYTGIWSLNMAGFSFGSAFMIFTRFVFFLVCVYTGRWLCIQWYLKHKLLYFASSTVVCCFLIALLWWLVVKHLFNYQDAGLIEVLISALPVFIIGVGLGILFKIIRVTIQKQIQDAQTLTRQKQSELDLLQSQLSPHFLFNTLNNLYGISIAHHERVPELLLKLSNLLRYSVYDTKKQFVSLQDEITYINNYIDFEQIRISDRLLLEKDIAPVCNNSILVAPMIFIVFIENAFKHAKNSLEKIYISITLKVSGNTIEFSTANSYNNSIEKQNIINEHSGLGIANTIKRLDLLYGKDYTLQQCVESNRYNVHLALKIKQALS